MHHKGRECYAQGSLKSVNPEFEVGKPYLDGYFGDGKIPDIVNLICEDLFELSKRILGDHFK